MKSEQEIKQLADRLLRSAGIAAPPVNVASIARSLGMEVIREKVESDLSGALYRLPDRTVIGINGEHSNVRQRFTIAHEIGHFVLHEQLIFIDRSFFAASIDPEEPSFRRDSRSSQATDPKEIEANRFAAALLMPKMFLISDISGYALPLTSDSVGALAKRYQVSQQAMTFRLINLGILIEQT